MLSSFCLEILILMFGVRKQSIGRNIYGQSETERRVQKCVDENARIAQDQREYHKRYTALHDRYDAAKTWLDKIYQEAQEQASKREVVIQFLADLEQQSGVLAEFDEQLWYATVEAITVHSAKDMRITFKDGSIIQA